MLAMFCFIFSFVFCEAYKWEHSLPFCLVFLVSFKKKRKDSENQFRIPQGPGLWVQGSKALLPGECVMVCGEEAWWGGRSRARALQKAPCPLQAEKHYL